MERTSLSSNKYLRLVYCLVETCSEIARTLLLFYLETNRPEDFQDRTWSIDAFLYENGERVPKLNPSQRAIVYPGIGINTDVNKWDISLLFTILEMFDLDNVIKKDIMAIKKMRNKIFHAASTQIEDGKCEAYKQKISVYVQDCCDITGDQTLATDVENIFKEADETKLNKQTQTRVMSDFDNWFKSDRLFECIDKIPSDIGSIMDVLFEQIVNLLRGCNFRIPDAYLSLQIRGCNPGISELVSEQLYGHLGEGISQGESRLGRAIADAHTLLIDKHRKLVEIRRGCLILCIRSEDFEGFWCLISDCISGKLTASWSDVQNIVREEQNAPYLTIAVGVTASEIINCVEELVQNISEGMQVGNEIQKRLSTKRTFHAKQTTKDQVTRDDDEIEKPQEITTNTDNSRYSSFEMDASTEDECSRPYSLNALRRALWRENMVMRKNELHVLNDEHENDDDATDYYQLKVLDDRGWTALHYAVSGGSVEYLQYLIDLGIDYHQTSNDGSTILHIAASKGHKDLVYFIIKHCQDLLDITNIYGWTALHFAAQSNSPACIEILINAGLSYKTTANKGETLLHIAALSGQIHNLKYIASHCKDILHEVDRAGNTALHYAANSNSQACVEFLIRIGFLHPLIVNKIGQTILLSSLEMLKM